MTTEQEVGLIPRGRKPFAQVDYSALDRTTIEQALDDYVRANFPEQQDYTQSTGYKIISRQIAYVVDLLSYRADYLANNNYLPSCTNLRALDNLLSLIGYRRSGVQAAVADVAVVPQTTVGNTALPAESGLTIRVPARTQITGTGKLGRPVTFELFASSTNIFDDIEVPTGASNVIAHAIEGISKTVVVKSTGERFMRVTLPDLNVVLDTIRVNVGLYDAQDPNAGTQYNPNLPQWERVDFVVVHGAENVYESKVGNDGLSSISFGDGTFGNVIPKGQDLVINYRVGGGENGNAPAGNVRSSGSFNIFNGGLRTPATMRCTLENVTRGVGGRDEESIEEAKFLAPLVYQAQNRAVKDIDYTALALKNTKVAKAVAVSRQDIIVDSYEDAVTYDFPLFETQPYTLELEIHRLDTRSTKPYRATFKPKKAVYTDINELVVDINLGLGWTYDEASLAFKETTFDQGFIARLDVSIEGFIELWIKTGDYQARATLKASGNSILPIIRMPYGTYGRVDANYVDLYCLTYAEDGNVAVPNAALVNELRTYFDTYKCLNTQVTVRRGFIQRVDIEGNIFLDRSADPLKVKLAVDTAIKNLFATKELGEALPVSKIFEAVEAIEGVSYVDEFKPAQNVFPGKTTLLQLGDVDVTFYEAKQ